MSCTTLSLEAAGISGAKAHLAAAGRSGLLSDARQEAMLKAFTRLDQFAGNSDDKQDDLHAWVSRITTNAAIDLLRQRRDSILVPLEKNGSESGDNFAERVPARGEN